ncbi:hypothetical protein SK128_014152, partial [Halocaridina rubra]
LTLERAKVFHPGDLMLFLEKNHCLSSHSSQASPGTSQGLSFQGFEAFQERTK